MCQDLNGDEREYLNLDEHGWVVVQLDLVGVKYFVILCACVVLMKTGY